MRHAVAICESSAEKLPGNNQERVFCMKICLVAPYFAPARGGVETYTLHVCLLLRETYGHDVFVVTTRHGYGPMLVEERVGFKTYLLPAALKLSNTPVDPGW